MKTLDTIQKTYGVFRILAKIAMILSFIWAGVTLIGALCGIMWRTGGDFGIIVWSTGGNDYGITIDMFLKMTQTDGVDQAIAVLLSDFVCALANGFLFFFAYRYFKQELKDGTPFTASGADRVRNLGIKTIVMPLVAVIISAVIYACFGVKRYDNLDNGASVVLGIALILFSLILKHGSELRENNNE